VVGLDLTIRVVGESMGWKTCEDGVGDRSVISISIHTGSTIEITDYRFRVNSLIRSRDRLSKGSLPSQHSPYILNIVDSSSVPYTITPPSSTSTSTFNCCFNASVSPPANSIALSAARLSRLRSSLASNSRRALVLLLPLGATPVKIL